MRPADDIEQTIRDLRFTTSAEADARILADAEAALDETRQSQPDPKGSSVWRTIMQSRRTRIATGAVVVIMAGLAYQLATDSETSHVAFGQVISYVAQARTAKCEMVLQPEGLPEQTFQVMRLEPGRQRITFPSGTVAMVAHAGHDTTLMLDLKKKKATLLKRDSTSAVAVQEDSFEEFKQLCEGAEEVLGEQEIDGRLATGFRVRKSGMDWMVWADPETGLPIRVEQSGSPALGSATLVMKNFVFDVELDESLFSIEPPADYEVVEKQVPRLQPTEEDLVETLRIYADLMDGAFPPALDFLTIGKQLREAGKKKLGEERVTKLMTGIVFIMKLPADSDHHYAGEPVRFGDADAPVFWYRPEGSETYRVIYGDLSVSDAGADGLPSATSPTP